MCLSVKLLLLIRKLVQLFTYNHAFCPSDAYTDEDLMLYWKSGDESLSTDDKISLSQFLIQKFHTTSRLAFYSSTGRMVEQRLSSVLHRYFLQGWITSSFTIWQSIWSNYSIQTEMWLLQLGLRGPIPQSLLRPYIVSQMSKTFLLTIIITVHILLT